jgi:acyl carrier protein
MTVPNAEQLATLVALIKDVKPGLSDTTIEADNSLIEHLGLDSLDVLQLSRKINKAIGTFDLDEWNEAGKGTLQSILDQVNAADSVTSQSDLAAT